ncbi:MAG: hypothetical protein AUJ92_22110 [Armatimonadetes bacterium CG2_30_59_28]|nr:hypothetical protein [Armatimonadota bacterium]OIO89205.1 MAG: hypothetical protein AUJ92_22110 [Armatimonadetes bacterium CG2_30_59_28]PIU60627.1 MAG: hypothetical protein COS85_23465 [Armatimonadetes bacterium CG07_land_8_20_14_0_80_59_28]PIX44468.1 MAG: hypothetical protein COZ56_04425 [Armatimonadetes bacterium CG_4_8_14_3_um_filter_58_9]PIY43173.1 MAG: hypothetical protein COZ05_11860 [Armatimonadetes bacterium CG_4_10_14_3_um_filter_59_10]PJB63543.1 MAG: hypothetical protein CO095_163
MIRRTRAFAVLLLSAAALCGSSADGVLRPRVVTLTDYLGFEWTDELVHDTLNFPKGQLTGVAVARVENESGKPVPSQTSDVKRHEDGSIRSCNVWFFADVPPNGSATYRTSCRGSRDRRRTACAFASLKKNNRN